MSTTDTATGTDDSIVEEYVLGVRIVDVGGAGERYRFEAPEHAEVTFDDPDDAQLYADVYFDVNGFVEAGTGDRGVPPEIIQGGKDTLAAYLVTRPWADVNWVASFYGAAPEEIERYVSWVSRRAEEIRETVRDRGLE